MICNYCFSNENIKKYIKENGIKAKQAYQCPNCQEINNEDLIEPIYMLSRSELAKKLQEVIQNLYEHETVHGLYGSAVMFAREENDEPNDYAGCLSLEEVCWECFNDGDSLAQIISSNVNIRDIQQGEDDLFSDTYSAVWKDKCWWNNEHFGLSQWQTFCENVKHKARYFNHKDFSVTNFLKKFKKALEKIEYSDNLTIYRARKINSLEEEITIKSNPTCELGKVPIKCAQNNRFSPVGISYGYFAIDELTAIKEIRAKQDEQIAIGKFTITDELKLIDFRFQSMKNKVNIFNDALDFSLYCQQRFIKDFLQDISKPIKDSDRALEYIPTQIVAEFIWHLGYDGFLYDSSQNESGVNLVIFEAKYKYISFETAK